jgi:nucleoside-diphosphate-sugar epimerase
LKVLLTGASGFVGSHILDSLRARGIPTLILLRPTSNQRFLQHHLPKVQVRPGSITEPEGLRHAMAGITHVIHCAGCTRVRRIAEFRQINHLGTRNVVEAANLHAASVKRVVHISSLAVSGPAAPVRPAREDDPPKPVSEYGRSKLAGELELRHTCKVDFTILRPPAVYGPRDLEFLGLFKAVKNHLLPRPSGKQALSLVFAPDLAEAAVACLEHPAAVGRTYFVAAREIVTGRLMGEEIAARMQRWTLPCPVPMTALWLLCLAHAMGSRLTRRPSLLNLQKFAELRAPGWVCDPSRFENEIGYQCRTTLNPGITETLSWYRQNKWL